MCRDKQNIDSYDEQLIPNRWWKEFEPADDDIHVVQTSIKITIKKLKTQTQRLPLKSSIKKCQSVAI